MPGSAGLPTAHPVPHSQVPPGVNSLSSSCPTAGEVLQVSITASKAKMGSLLGFSMRRQCEGWELLCVLGGLRGALHPLGPCACVLPAQLAWQWGWRLVCCGREAQVCGN